MKLKSNRLGARGNMLCPMILGARYPALAGQLESLLVAWKWNTRISHLITMLQASVFLCQKFEIRMGSAISAREKREAFGVQVLRK